ncbi:MAG: glycosyltransferase family 2 protein [Deltaproteobacteria bacterium]
MKLSVIIPALNEEDFLPDTIRMLRENSVSQIGKEIIVSDSGSDDGTPELALRLGARLVESKDRARGRAVALNRGAGAATGDVFLFLDADTTPPYGYDACIERVLSDPETVGGAFEFSLDGAEFGLRVVEFLNRIRYRLRQRYYGDQGIFVRADVFRRVGGCPERPILEAAYLCKALRKEGKLKLVGLGMNTSPRRFIEGGIYRVLAKDIKIWFLDLIGFSVDNFADDYWKENRVRAKK